MRVGGSYGDGFAWLKGRALPAERVFWSLAMGAMERQINMLIKLVRVLGVLVIGLCQISCMSAKLEFVSIDRENLPDYDRAGSPAPEAVPLRNDEGLWNLSLLKSARAYASSVIPGYPRRHQISNIRDGWYNNCASWIPASMPAWVEVDLGEKHKLYKIAFGSEHSSHYSDRAATKFSVFVANQYSENLSPFWAEVYRYDDSRNPIRETTKFNFEKPVEARYLRICVDESVGGDVRIDELEIYGK
jgi:hypothetical protein